MNETKLFISFEILVFDSPHQMKKKNKIDDKRAKERASERAGAQNEYKSIFGYTFARIQMTLKHTI